METEILKYILDNQGAVVTADLLFNLCNTTVLTELLCNNDKFVTCLFDGTPKIVVRSAVKLCWRKDCPGCGGLHLCKGFFLTGSCQFSATRRGCLFSHDIHSAYNEKILQESGLETLCRTQLCTLLLQSNNNILPPICYNYNNRNGCQDSCTRLHICEKSLVQECGCFRTHDFLAPQPSAILKDRRIPDSLLPSLKYLYANKEALKLSEKQANTRNKGASGLSELRAISCQDLSNDRFRGGIGNQGSRQDISSSDVDGASMSFFNSNFMQIVQGKYAMIDVFDSGVEANNTFHAKSSQGFGKGKKAEEGEKQSVDKRQNQRKKDKTEICMYFIKGHCKHEDRCFKAHDKMPYRWQMKQEGHWTNMAANESIEQAYCDPANTYSSTIPLVYFETMKCGENDVRRLSTTNSALEPNFIHTTDWLWYWEDDHGRWHQYGAHARVHELASVTSNQLEGMFLNNDKDVVQFKAGSQMYELSFQDMIQTNIQYHTKRIVRRRPQFVSAAEVQTKKKRPPKTNTTTFPEYWDKAQISPTEHRRIILQPSQGEYKEIHDLFCQTMKGFDILKIERIQNKAIWEAFQLHKDHLKTKNKGQPVAEKKLFHGTDPSLVNTICATNFDWRVCGINGTVYGQGSYFARDAKYSHSYTGNSDIRFMFVSRVLVGEYTRGRSEYRRPPSKDGGDVNLYDSCVDDVANPSIFVVFEKQQIYPEYVLQYRSRDRPNVSQQPVTVTTVTPLPQSSASAVSANVSTNPIASFSSASANVSLKNHPLSSSSSSNSLISNLATTSATVSSSSSNSFSPNPTLTSPRLSSPTSLKYPTQTSSNQFGPSPTSTYSGRSSYIYGLNTDTSVSDSSFRFAATSSYGSKEAFKPLTPRKNTKESSCVIA